MSNDGWSWSPDREPNPRPIHGWGERLDPSVRADVPFMDTDDPEGAQAWLDSQMARNLGEPEVEQLHSDDWSVYGADQTTEWVRSPADQAESGRDFFPMAEYVAEEIRASMAEYDRVRERVASLPDGEMRLNGYVPDRLIEFPRPNRPYPDPPELSGEELADRTRQVYPAGCFQDPPTPVTRERPDFPRGEMTGIESIRMIIRMNNGWEEIYEITHPARMEFHSGVDRREANWLRKLVISIGSPRNWRRLPSRRWQ